MGDKNDRFEKDQLFFLIFFIYTKAVSGLKNDRFEHNHYENTPMPYEPQCEKTGLRGFGPGATQISLYSHRSRLDA